MKCHYFSCRISQKKEIAGSKLPKIGGCVLDRALMMSRHERSDVREICDSFRGLRQHPLSLLRELLKCYERTMELLVNLTPRVLPEIILHDEQADAGECGRGEDERKKKFRP